VSAIRLKESTKENYDYQALFGGYGSGYYLVEDRTFYNMKTGKAVGSIPRDGYDSVNVYPGFLVVEDLQGKNTVYGADFTPLGEAEKVYYGYVFEKNGDQWEVRRAGDGQAVFATPYEVSGYNRYDGTFRTSDKGKAGRLGPDGALMVKPAFENLYDYSGGFIRAKQERDGKMGVLDEQGNAVVPFLYDDVVITYVRGLSVGPDTLTFVRGYAPVELDRKIGFVSRDGTETLKPTYVKDAVKVKANTLLIIDAAGKITLVAADGTVTGLPYAEAQHVQNAADGRLVQVKNEEGLYGIVDWHGNLVLPFGNYSGYDTYTSSDGSLLLVGNRDTRMVEAYAVR